MNYFVLGLLVNAGMVIVASGLLYLKLTFWHTAAKRNHLAEQPS